MWNKKYQSMVLFFVCLSFIILTGCATEKKTVKKSKSSTSFEKVIKNTPDSPDKKAKSLMVPKKNVSKSIPENEALKKYLSEITNSNLGIQIKALSEKQTYGMNDKKVFYGASVAKLPIILYTLHCIQNNKISMSTEYPYTSDVNNVSGGMVVGGTGSLQYEAVNGKNYSVSDLLRRAIQESDNLASNFLSYYVGDKNGVDFRNFISHYYGEEIPVFTKNLTASTANQLIAAIYQTHLVDQWFENTQWAHEKIGVLPYTVLHKIGINGSYNHDSGVILSKNPYALTILSDGYSNQQIQQIVRKIDSILTK